MLKAGVEGIRGLLCIEIERVGAEWGDMAQNGLFRGALECINGALDAKLARLEAVCSAKAGLDEELPANDGTGVKRGGSWR
jgi:hypothetical protein